MFPLEQLRDELPLKNENGPGLGIGPVKDGVVVVTAVLLSTKAIVSVLLEGRVSCSLAVRNNGVVDRNSNFPFIPVTN